MYFAFCPQTVRQLLDEDEFLKGVDNKLFTNAAFHKLFAGMSLVTTEVPAPKIAFILSKVVEMLRSRDPSVPLPDSSSFHPDDVEHGSYYRALTFVRGFAGKHWATHPGQGASQEPTHTCINIVIPQQVCCAYDTP